jgi:hypothetical protein
MKTKSPIPAHVDHDPSTSAYIGGSLISNFTLMFYFILVRKIPLKFYSKVELSVDTLFQCLTF